jgi:hypothetical protein
VPVQEAGEGAQLKIKSMAGNPTSVVGKFYSPALKVRSMKKDLSLQLVKSKKN